MRMRLLRPSLSMSAAQPLKNLNGESSSPVVASGRSCLRQACHAFPESEHA